jgi:hypothetical protein
LIVKAAQAMNRQRMLRIIRPEKQAKLHCLQILRLMNGDNFNKVKTETNRYVRNKMKKYFKDIKISLEQRVRTKILDLCRVTHEFENGYQCINN